MTPKEFTKRMREAARIEDMGSAHITADRIMVELLYSEGYGEGLNIFEKMIKGYSP